MTTTAIPEGKLSAPHKKHVDSDRAVAENRLGQRLVAPAVIMMLLVTAYPMCRALYLSLFRYRLTAPDDKSFVGLGNYGTILTDSLFWRDTWNTVVIMVLTVAVELVIGFAFAMVMHRIIFARGLMRTSILIPYGIITVVSAFAWQFTFSINNGWVNAWFSWLPGISASTNWYGDHWHAMFAIMVSEIWKTTPFMSLLLLAGLSQISEDMIEAAKVDGATAAQRLFKVILPNMKAAIMVAVLFRALDAFRIFDNIFIMTRGAQNTESSSFLTYRQSIEQFQLGLGSALSVLLFLTVLLLAYLIVKIFRVDLASARGERLMRKSSIGTWIGFVLIMIWCLLPVAWIVSLSFKSLAETTVGSPQFLPKDPTTENYKVLLGMTPDKSSSQDFLASLRNSFGICLIATVLAVAIATLAAYAIARLDFPGKRLVLSMALGDRDVPGRLDRRAAVRHVAHARPVQHLARPDHPLHDVHAADGDLDAVGVLPADPVGDGAGRPGRRRHPLAGVPQGDRAAGCAGRVHRGDPDVLLRLERLRARSLADVDDRLAHRAGRSWPSSWGRTRSTRRTPSWRRHPSSSPSPSSSSSCCSSARSSPASPPAQ